MLKLNEKTSTKAPTKATNLEAPPKRPVSRTPGWRSLPETRSSMARLAGYHASLLQSVDDVAAYVGPGQPQQDHSNATERNPGTGHGARNEPTAVERKAIQIRDAVKSQDIASASQAADKLVDSLSLFSPQKAKELMEKLEDNGALDAIVRNLAWVSKRVDGNSFRGDDVRDRLHFDNVVGALSHAVAHINDQRITRVVATVLAKAIRDDIGRFDEAFKKAIGEGRGASLAGALAQELDRLGQRGVSAKVTEAVEDGAKTFQNTFQDVAKKVDSANRELAYLIAQWAPFYGDTEDGREALRMRIEEFKSHRPEYAELNRLSANLGGDLEVLRDLQGLFPDKEWLKDRERDLLREVPRMASTENGRRSLAEAVERSGQGQDTFLDRLDDHDFRSNFSKSELKERGFENFDQFRASAGQEVLSAGLAGMLEAVERGDAAAVKKIGDGLVKQHALLGEEPSVLGQLTVDMKEISDAALGLAGTGGSRLSAAVSSLEKTIPRLENSAGAAKWKAAGALIGLIAGAKNWSGSEGDWKAAIAPLGSLMDGVQAIGTLGRNGFLAKLGHGAGKALGTLGVVIDGVGAAQALKDGDLVGAGISAASALGSVITIVARGGLGGGVGIALGLGAAVAGLVRAQWNKVKASNRYESAEARRFIREALEQAGLPKEHIDKVVGHFSNADDEGRQVGILIAQAAERAGITPKRLLQMIGSLSPGKVLDIVEAGHGVDPLSDDLYDLPPASEEVDSLVGSGHSFFDRPVTVEGFLRFLRIKYGLNV